MEAGGSKRQTGGHLRERAEADDPFGGFRGGGFGQKKGKHLAVRLSVSGLLGKFLNFCLSPGLSKDLDFVSEVERML